MGSKYCLESSVRLLILRLPCPSVYGIQVFNIYFWFNFLREVLPVAAWFSRAMGAGDVSYPDFAVGSIVRIKLLNFLWEFKQCFIARSSYLLGLCLKFQDLRWCGILPWSEFERYPRSQWNRFRKVAYVRTNINIVSGKSSIVCAICLGLGGNPTILGRSSDLKEFIQHGKNRSEIEIQLWVLRIARYQHGYHAPPPPPPKPPHLPFCSTT